MSSSAEPTPAVSPVAPSGLEHPGVIDLFTHDSASDVVTLVMTERRAWDGGEEQLFQLQEKLNAYLSFALDGELAEAYPALGAKPLRLRLDCRDQPSHEVAHLLEMVRKQIAFQGIELELRITGGAEEAAPPPPA